MEEEKQSMQEKVKEKTEAKINEIVAQGIQSGNVDFLSKLVDIYNDVDSEGGSKSKKEEKSMRYKAYGRDSYNEGVYGNYGKYEDNRFGENYGRRMRDSRGRYMARGYDAKYRGEEVLNGMYQTYQAYSDGKEMFGEGTYGHKEETMKSLEYMLQSVVDFITMLEEDANSQEEIKLIKKYTKHISEM